MFNLFSKFMNPLKGQNPMDWLQQFNTDPQNTQNLPNFMNSGTQMDFGSLNKYIQDTIAQSLENENFPNASNSQSKTQTPIPYELFELHDYYILHLHIPPYLDENALHVSLANCHLMISGLPNGDTQQIPLPAQPNEKGITAKCKNKLLEIRLPKKQNESSIDIKW